MRAVTLVLAVMVALSVQPFTLADLSDPQSPGFQRELELRWLQELLDKSKDKSLILPEEDAYGAVNGDRFDRNSGFHTDNEENPWWQVDLLESMPIGRILVFNRADCYQRENHIEILFSQDGSKWEPVYQHDGTPFHGGIKPEDFDSEKYQGANEPLSVDFNGKSARFVRLQIHNDYFHLREVEVYRQGDNETNVALKKPATQSTASGNSTRSIEKKDLAWYREPAPIDLFSKHVATEQDIVDLLDLAQRTLDYVSQEVELPKQTEQLKQLRERWDNGQVEPDQYNKFYVAVRHVRRDTLFEHPALDFEKLLINRTPPTKYSHNGDQHLGRHSRSGPGLTILTDWKTGYGSSKGPTVTPLLEGKLPEGSVRNPDLHYDAEKLAFAFCDHTMPGQRRFFLYEAAIDGSWVRQLTGTSRDEFKTWCDRATVIIEDNDPCYLPDDDLVFISTRSQSFGRCHGGRYNPAWVLHRCDPNGDGIKQLSFGNENEYEPSVLNDGRIVFTRWEYTNRHEMLFHMLWSCRPDGTEVKNFYGNDTIDPMMVVECSAIPNSHRVVATAQGHHSYNTGTTVVLDTNLGENGEEPVTHITPETPYSESHGWPSPHFSHPCAANEQIFFVSRANHPVHSQGKLPPVNDRAIYLVDSLGGREFIYEDPDVASFSPIIVRKRQRPPVLPSMLPENAPNYGTLFIQNAYLTRNDPDGIIQPDMIKAIRVNELGVQPRARRTALSLTVPVELPKKVLGTVPVDEDGSAFFRVPAGVSLQMQILDENGMAILTEKSFIYLQPGESRSCIGCHEPSGTTPDPRAFAKNALREPVDLTPPAGPRYEGGMSFLRSVQPVLDRYCIKCHGLEKTEGDVNLIADDDLFPRSLRAIVDRGEHYVGLKSYMGGGGAQYNISRPRRFYAYSNKVAHLLLENHGDVDMDHDSYMRIIEWLDTNAQATGDLFPNKIEQRRLDSRAMKDLREYVTELFGDKAANQPDRALVNPAQPEESRVLMAPLSVSAGGWLDNGGYTSKDDPRFVKLTELVDKCIVRQSNENVDGWNPSLEEGGGEDWVIKERQQYIDSLTGE